MSDNALENVKKIIKSLVIAQQNGLSSISLNNEFLEVEGRPIPFKSFGADSLTDFLRSLTDIIVMGTNKANEQVFFARVDSSTAHIANFVANQKPQTVKRRNNLVRNDDKRPCREPNPVYVPSPFWASPSSPPPRQPSLPPERIRSNTTSNGTNDHRREAERPERRRIPCPISISPPPQHSSTSEPDKFRNPSPPRPGRSHSFRDASPDRSRNRSLRDLSLPLQPSSSYNYEKALQQAKERRGLLLQRSRRSRSRSPSPRRRIYRPSPPLPSPPPRIITKTVSCQTEPDEVNAKKLVSVSCQTENLSPEKPVKAKAQTSQADGGDEAEQDLNQAFYGPNSYGINYNNNPYNSFSFQPIADPSYEEDKSQPGFYYDFDAGALKPIPLIPEWYAYWIWSGWAAPSAGSQHPSQPYNSHQTTLPPTSIPHVNSTPSETPSQPMKVIPITPSTNSTTRDPRLARQTANNNKNNSNVKANGQQQSTIAQIANAKRKALSINDYMKTRKLGFDKSQHIVSEETSEFPDKMNNSPDQLVKWVSKRS